MTFALPLALLGLLPWAVAAVAVWRRRNSTVQVPFVRLWTDRPTVPAGGRATRRPPLAVLLLLAAALLAVAGASGPSLRLDDRPAVAPARPTVSRLAVRRFDATGSSSPTGRAMVGVAGFDGRGEVVVRTGGKAYSARVESGDAATLFVDLPSLGPTVSAEPARPGGTGLTVDRSAGRPRVVAVGPLPPGVGRMAEVYGLINPPDPARPAVRVEGRPPDASVPAVIAVVVPTSSEADSTAGAWRVVDHPLMRATRFPGRPPDAASVSPGPPGDGWTPLVSGGGRVVLAVRTLDRADPAAEPRPDDGDRPTRQAWVGLTPGEWAAWARTPEFAAFFGRAFDWAGGVDRETVGVSIAEVSAAGGPTGPAGPRGPTDPLALAPGLLVASTAAAAAGVLLALRFGD